jgi:hypothetical protein
MLFLPCKNAQGKEYAKEAASYKRREMKQKKNKSH